MKQRIITVIKPINLELDDLWCSFFFLFWHFFFLELSELSETQIKTKQT